MWRVPQSLTLCQDKYPPPPVSGSQASGWNQGFTLPPVAWGAAGSGTEVITVTWRGGGGVKVMHGDDFLRALAEAYRTKPLVWGLFQVVCFALFSMGIVTWAYFNRLNYPYTLQSPWIYHLHPSPGTAAKAITSLGPNQWLIDWHPI